MSKITREDVLRLAKLSMIKLTDNEVDKLAEQLATIVEYVEKIDEVNANDLEATDQVTGLKNVMRTDELKNYKTTPSDLLKNVPAAENGQIKVKRILG